MEESNWKIGNVQPPPPSVRHIWGYDDSYFSADGFSIETIHGDRLLVRATKTLTFAEKAFILKQIKQYPTVREIAIIGCSFNDADIINLLRVLHQENFCYLVSLDVSKNTLTETSFKALAKFIADKKIRVFNADATMQESDQFESAITLVNNLYQENELEVLLLCNNFLSSASAISIIDVFDQGVRIDLRCNKICDKAIPQIELHSQKGSTGKLKVKGNLFTDEGLSQVKKIAGDKVVCDKNYIVLDPDKTDALYNLFEEVYGFPAPASDYYLIHILQNHPINNPGYEHLCFILCAALNSRDTVSTMSNRDLTLLTLKLYLLSGYIAWNPLENNNRQVATEVKELLWRKDEANPIRFNDISCSLHESRSFISYTRSDIAMFSFHFVFQHRLSILNFDECLRRYLIPDANYYRHGEHGFAYGESHYFQEGYRQEYLYNLVGQFSDILKHHAEDMTTEDFEFHMGCILKLLDALKPYVSMNEFECLDGIQAFDNAQEQILKTFRATRKEMKIQQGKDKQSYVTKFGNWFTSFRKQEEASNTPRPTNRKKLWQYWANTGEHDETIGLFSAENHSNHQEEEGTEVLEL